MGVNMYYTKEIDQESYSVVKSKDIRVPIDTTIQEILNPSGIIVKSSEDIFMEEYFTNYKADF